MGAGVIYFALFNGQIPTWQGGRALPLPSIDACTMQALISMPDESLEQLLNRFAAQPENAALVRHGRQHFEFFLRPISDQENGAHRHVDGTISFGMCQRALQQQDRRLAADVLNPNLCILVGLYPSPVRPARSLADIGVFVGDEERNPLCYRRACALPHARPDGMDLAANAPGATWLQLPSLPAHAPTRSQVASVAAAVGGVAAIACTDPFLHHGHTAPLNSQVLGPDTCAALVSEVDAAWQREHGNETRADVATAADTINASGDSLAASVRRGSCRDDFKMMLSPAALEATIGSGAYAAIVAALDGAGTTRQAPDAIAIRRTSATGRWIGFHTDRAARTVQIPLRSDQAGHGGELVFALADGSLVRPTRRAGCVLAHAGDAVHGVTRLVSGLRYGLFVLRARIE